jgi:tetratricopeptide (TPR) repeat protein
LIFAGPGIDSRRIDEYVCHVDIFPSLCDFLGIEKPSFLQGVSLLPLMEGKKIKKRAIYFESLGPYFNQGWAPLRGFIEEREKFMDSPLPEFYDLEDDFDESKNIVHRINPDRYRKKLKKIEEEFSSPQESQSRQKIDREALEKLRTLGYIDSPVSQLKNSYGPEDDLKTLLPLRQKLDGAIILHDRGEVEASIKLLNEAIQKRKDFATAYLYLYHIYKTQGRTEEVMEIMEKGLNNNPENYFFFSTYGIFLVMEKKWDKGIEVLEKALALVDFDPEVWNFLGLAYWRKGDDQKALEYYRKAISLDDSDALVFSNMGALYFSIFMRSKKRKALIQSMEYFKKAIELDPNLAAAYRGLGAGYGILGQTKEAISILEKALELSPKDDHLVLNLGNAHLVIGRKAQALKYFEKYLVLKKDTISTEERKNIEALIQKCKKK